jgi:hypothetical protein
MLIALYAHRGCMPDTVLYIYLLAWNHCNNRMKETSPTYHGGTVKNMSAQQRLPYSFKFLKTRACTYGPVQNIVENSHNWLTVYPSLLRWDSPGRKGCSSGCLLFLAHCMLIYLYLYLYCSLMLPHCHFWVPKFSLSTDLNIALVSRTLYIY